MEQVKIDIYQKDTRQKSFDEIQYKKMLDFAFSKLPNIIRVQFQQALTRYAISHPLTDQGRKIKIRDIAKSGYVVLSAKNPDLIKHPDTDRLVTLEKISRGRIKNYPSYVNMYIEEFLNYSYLFSTNTLEDIDKLYSHIIALPDIEAIIPVYYKSIEFNPILYYGKEYKISDIDVLESVQKAIYYKYGVTLRNIMDLENNLTSVLCGMISGNNDTINSELEYFINDSIYKKQQSVYSELLFQKQAELAIIARIVKSNGYDLKYNGLKELKPHIPGDLYKLIEERLKLSYKRSNPCIAHDLIDTEYKKTRFKKMYKNLDDIELLFDSIKSICNYHNHLYHCKTCKALVACDHQFAAVKVLYDKNRYDDLVKETDEYAEKIGVQYFCKYCFEHIRDEAAEYATEFDIQKQQLSVVENTDILISNSIFGVLFTCLSLFKFKYEFSESQLVKSMHPIIAPKVISYISNFSEEEIPEMARLCAFIYGGIYLMFVYLKDPNITTDRTVKNPGLFANDLIKITLKKFGRSDEKMIKKITAYAFHDLKFMYTLKVSYEDSNRLKVDVENTLQYQYIRQAYCTFQLLKKLVPKIDISFIPSDAKYNKMTFHKKIVLPEMTDYSIAMYLYLFGFDSHCYLSKEQFQPLKFVTGKFDSTFEDKLKIEYTKSLENFRVINYKNLILMKSENYFNKSYPANYIYQKNGSIINWESELCLVKTKEKKISAYGRLCDTKYATRFFYYIEEEKEDKNLKKDLKKRGLDRDGNLNRDAGLEKDKDSSLNRDARNISVKKIFLEKMKLMPHNELVNLIDARNKVLNYTSIKFKAHQGIKCEKIKNRQEPYKFIFETKLYGVVTKISPKYVVNTVKMWGQSEGINFDSIRSGSYVPPAFKVNDVRIYKILNYAEILVKKYTSLISRPDLKQNLEILNQSGIELNDFISLNLKQIIYSEAGKYNGHFHKVFNSILTAWKPEDVYLWLMQFILDRLTLILETKIGPIFCHEYIEQIFRFEKFGYETRATYVHYVEDNDFEEETNYTSDDDAPDYAEMDEDNINDTK